MGTEWTDNRKNLMLFSGRAHPELADQVAKELDVPVTAQTARDFANGEIFVRFDESVRGCDAFVLQSHPWPLNKWLMEQLIMIDALKRGSAKRITAIMPFYPYARQDKKHRGREPISARLVADLLKTAGVDRIITVDLHTDQIQGFFDGPVDHMRAQSLLCGYIAENYADHDMVVVSPDSGRVRVAEKWADALGGVPLAFIHKTRDPLIPNQVKSNRVVGDVKGKTCILTDDMIDTGGTIAGAVKLLHEDGARDVIITATHGVLSDPAPQRLADCGAREVIVTNTLPIGENKQFPQLTVLSIAPLLASTIRAVFENGSVTGLFDGSAIDEARKTMRLTIYHNPRCSTSRKTLDLLRDNGIEPTVVQYLKTPPSRAELVKMIKDAGIDVRKAVRKRESLYDELHLAEADDDELLDAMAEHPILIERPFVVTPKGTRLARPIDAVREIL